MLILLWILNWCQIVNPGYSKSYKNCRFCCWSDVTSLRCLLWCSWDVSNVKILSKILKGGEEQEQCHHWKLNKPSVLYKCQWQQVIFAQSFTVTVVEDNNKICKFLYWLPFWPLKSCFSTNIQPKKMIPTALESSWSALSNENSISRINDNYDC